MTDKLSLAFDSRKTIQQRFEEFHVENPWVMDELLRLARQARDGGALKIGIGMLWEVLRWRYYERTQDWNGSWRLNNSYRSRYVRALIDLDPSLADLFELRELKAT